MAAPNAVPAMFATDHQPKKSTLRPRKKATANSQLASSLDRLSLGETRHTLRQNSPDCQEQKEVAGDQSFNMHLLQMLGYDADFGALCPNYELDVPATTDFTSVSDDSAENRSTKLPTNSIADEKSPANADRTVARIKKGRKCKQTAAKKRNAKKKRDAKKALKAKKTSGSRNNMRMKTSEQYQAQRRQKRYRGRGRASFRKQNQPNRFAHPHSITKKRPTRSRHKSTTTTPKRHVNRHGQKQKLSAVAIPEEQKAHGDGASLGASESQSQGDVAFGTCVGDGSVHTILSLPDLHEEPHKLEEGDALGHYKIRANLGKGAFGRVYKALNTRTNKVRAIKDIIILGMDEDEVKIVKKEALLMKKLHHPNIVRFVESFADGPHFCIALEFVEGGCLRSYAKKFDIEWPESNISSLMLGILSGLEYLHAQGIIHRDIKAENILLHHNGVVKLADFGVSYTDYDEKKDVKELAGSPFWIAPEIIKKQRLTPACDIWSLGATAIELKTKYPPFYHMGPTLAMRHIKTKGVLSEIPRRSSPLFRDFLTLCCAMKPEQRPSATELKQHGFIRNAQQEN